MTLTRIGYAALAAASIGASLSALQPRLMAFNQSSQGHQIAMARSETCLLTSLPIVANEIVLDKSGHKLPDGTFLCDLQGNTVQVTNGGASGYLKSGQPELITAKLRSRGLIQNTPITGQK
jgi:hypothetical protein